MASPSLSLYLVARRSALSIRFRLTVTLDAVRALLPSDITKSGIPLAEPSDVTPFVRISLIDDTNVCINWLSCA